MAAKKFKCTNCGAVYIKWQGKCGQCDSWGTVEEDDTPTVKQTAAAALKPQASARLSQATTNAKAVKITDISKDGMKERLSTNISEFDRVLGGGIVRGGVLLLAGAPGSGKALALNTRIPTPDGWTLMRDIQTGDYVYDRQGKPTKVTAVTEVMTDRECYLIEFSDGTSIVADAQHEWVTAVSNSHPRFSTETIKTTRQIAATLEVDSGRLNHSIRITEPLQGEEKELLLPPYTLGAWLGDGHSAGGRITGVDSEIFDNIRQEGVIVKKNSALYGYSLSFPRPEMDFYKECRQCGKELSSTSQQRQGRGNCNEHKNTQTFQRTLRELNLINNKHIPSQYLRASVSQRRALLAGILDTDGTISKSGSVTIGVTNGRLAADIYDLIIGLGFKGSRTQKRVFGRTEESSTFYMITFTPEIPVFKLSRKNARITSSYRKTNRRIYIKNVTRIETVPVKCIQVDNDEHMYLAGESMIPTHNSTLLGAVSKAIANSDKQVLYISGEENETQIASRHDRIGALSGNIWILSESNVDNAVQHIYDIKPDLVIVDSIQTLLSSNSEGRVGSPSQVTEVANTFTQIAKQTNTPTLMIGHLTKNDSIAGPRVVEHLVDVVLYLEADPDSSLRLLRGVKNRYGSTEEVGVFIHTSDGLEEMTDPNDFFTNLHEDETAGFAVSSTVEGIRVLPVEVQALVSPTRMPNPRKITQGLEHGRALQIQAVLDKYVPGLRLHEQDVYVSTVGGLKINDPGTDLAVAAALLSSRMTTPMSSESIYIGEVTLTGEIRPARDQAKRVKEASRLFRNVYAGPMSKKVELQSGANLYTVKTIAELGDIIKSGSAAFNRK